MKNLSNVSTKSWLGIFFVEWIIPKVSIVFSVFCISRILFAVDVKYWSDGVIGYILDLFKLSNNPILPWVAGFVAVLIIPSLFTSYAEGKIQKIAFYLERKRSHIAIAVLFALNILLVPASFAFFYAFHFDLNALMWFSVLLGVIFVAISMAFHYFPYMETNPANYVAYQLKPKHNYNKIIQNIGDAKEKISSELKQRKIDFIYDPEIVLSSKDGQGMIVIPLGVEYDKWADDAKKKLDDALSKIDSVLSDKWESSRFKSAGIVKKIKK